MKPVEAARSEWDELPSVVAVRTPVAGSPSWEPPLGPAGSEMVPRPAPPDAEPAPVTPTARPGMLSGVSGVAPGPVDTRTPGRPLAPCVVRGLAVTTGLPSLTTVSELDRRPEGQSFQPTSGAARAPIP